MQKLWATVKYQEHFFSAAHSSRPLWDWKPTQKLRSHYKKYNRNEKISNKHPSYNNKNKALIRRKHNYKKENESFFADYHQLKLKSRQKRSPGIFCSIITYSHRKNGKYPRFLDLRFGLYSPNHLCYRKYVQLRKMNVIQRISLFRVLVCTAQTT